jgi:hypothetical protein
MLAASVDEMHEYRVDCVSRLVSFEVAVLV